MADFIENEGVEYPAKVETPTVEQTEAVTEQTEVPVEENKEEQTTEQVADKVEAEQIEQPEEELVILPEEQQAEVAEQGLNGVTEIFGSEFKTKEEAKAYFENLKKENETLKTQSETVFANDTVKSLNDYMKNGGINEKEFLDTKFAQKQIEAGIEQLKSLDPLEAVKHDLKTTHGLNADEIELYMSTKNDIELKIEGNKLKNEYINQLNNTLQQSKQQEADMIKSVTERQIQFKERVQTFVNELKDVDGVQVNDKDKQALSKILSNPTDYIKRQFPLDEKGLPTKEWVVNAARLQNSARLVSALKTKVSNANADGKKEVFNQLHNIPKQEATAKVVAGVSEETEGSKINKLLQQQQNQRHYN